MVEKIAINRTIFTDPEIIIALLRAWDEYDSGNYSTLALRHVFRAIRRVVCDNHTDVIIEVRIRDGRTKSQNIILTLENLT